MRMSRPVTFVLDDDIAETLARRFPDMPQSTRIRHALRAYLDERGGSGGQSFSQRQLKDLDEIIRAAMRDQERRGK